MSRINPENSLPLPSVYRNKVRRMTALKSYECRLMTEYGWNRGVIISLHPVRNAWDEAFSFFIDFIERK